MACSMELFVLAYVYDGDEYLFLDDVEHCHSGTAFALRYSYNGACIYQ